MHERERRQPAEPVAGEHDEACEQPVGRRLPQRTRRRGTGAGAEQRDEAGARHRRPVAGKVLGDAHDVTSFDGASALGERRRGRPAGAGHRRPVQHLVPEVRAELRAGARHGDVDVVERADGGRDVDDDRAHVVAGTRVERAPDELVRGVLRVGDVLEHRADLGVPELARESVGADEQAVVQPRGQQPVVRLGLVARAQRARQHVALRVGVGVRGLDPALVEQLLDHRVVDADLLEHVLGPAVHARVAHVEDEPVRGVVVHGDRDPRDRRAALTPAGELAADARGGPREARVDVVGGRGALAGELRELLNGDPAGEVARVVTAHAVGDEEDRRVREKCVLVDLADEPAVGG